MALRIFYVLGVLVILVLLVEIFLITAGRSPL